MRIDNGRYRKVTMDWTDITPPLKAGTPISLAGTISNDGDAIGIVPVTLMAQEFMPASIYILDAGDVDLAEVETLSGLTIAESAKEAMPAIHWHHADGTVDDYATGGGSGGSGAYDGYDIVLRATSLEGVSASDIEIVKGTIQGLEEKLTNGEGVTGVFEVFEGDGEQDEPKYSRFELGRVEMSYRTLGFSGDFYAIDFNYDSTYEVNSVALMPYGWEE